MLYSTPDGERKIRVFNIYIPLEKRFSSIFRYIDQDTLFQLLVKQSLSEIMTKKIVSLKENLIMSVVKILAAFRSDGVTVTNPTEIIVPDSLRYLNLYTLGALKSPAFRLLGEVKADEKYYWVLKILGSSMPRIIKLCSPRMYKITDIWNESSDYGYPDDETGKIIKPNIWDNLFENMSPEDLCIIDDGEYIYLYVGRSFGLSSDQSNKNQQNRNQVSK